MSVCAHSDDMEIPKDIRTWGEEHLEPDNVYRLTGNQLSSFISWDEL